MAMISHEMAMGQENRARIGTDVKSGMYSGRIGTPTRINIKTGHIDRKTIKQALSH
jgi:hypothetical protein